MRAKAISIRRISDPIYQDMEYRKLVEGLIGAGYNQSVVTRAINQVRSILPADFLEKYGPEAMLKKKSEEVGLHASLVQVHDARRPDAMQVVKKAWDELISGTHLEGLLPGESQWKR